MPYLIFKRWVLNIFGGCNYKIIIIILNKNSTHPQHSLEKNDHFQFFVENWLWKPLQNRVGTIKIWETKWDNF